ncbi:MAG: transcription factor S [Promethearchaeota archaeon]|jgi:transcription factor S
MVQFCPECSNLLRKKKEDEQDYLICKCGYQENDDSSLDPEHIEKKKKDLEENLLIITNEDKISVNVRTRRICPKCEYKEAETWQVQTRSSDEPSTHFFKCLECKYTWREY